VVMAPLVAMGRYTVLVLPVSAAVPAALYPCVFPTWEESPFRYV
jgi:hypothetical protein